MLVLFPTEQSIRKIVDAVNQLIQGRSNAVGEVTLTANAATTIVSRATMNSTAIPLLIPTTSNAALEQAAGTMFVSSVTAADFTITHASNAQTDRTFGYLVVGG